MGLRGVDRGKCGADNWIFQNTTHPLWAGSSIECERTSQPKMGPQLYSGVRESLNAGPPPPLML